MARAAAFFATAIAAVYFANAREGWLFSAILLAGGGTFAALLLRHVEVRRRLGLQRALAEVNRQELRRLEGRWRDVPVGPYDLPPASHPYAHDLDLFGPASLAQLLDRSGTALGAARLHGWLLAPAPIDDVARRQRLAQALSPLLDFRQRLQALGTMLGAPEAQPQAVEGLLAWIQAPHRWEGSGLRALAARISPVLAIGGLAAALAWALPWWVVLLAGLGNIALLASTARELAQADARASRPLRTLRQFEAMFRHIEETPLPDPALEELAAPIRQGRASREVRRLAGWLEQIESRNNPWFYMLANIWILHDVRGFFGLLDWKARHREALPVWIDRLCELEALCSLAGLAYSEPGFAFPELLEEGFQYRAKRLGHPLIPASARVCNDFSFGGKGQAGIMTGANMSGKSTFLRTLGVNAVLAFAGAPVCAEALSLSSFLTFTSMRTQDSLEGQVSGFYAELKRLEALLRRLEEGQDLFFLLDEVLKGTNSADQNKGAKALLRLLSGHRAFGLLSTHDLSLGEWGAQSGLPIRNYSFNSQVADGKLAFDHRLSEEICHSFSAAALLRGIGIDVPD